MRAILAALRKELVNSLQLVLGESPAQWACAVLTGLGVVLIFGSADTWFGPARWPGEVMLLGYVCLFIGIVGGSWAMRNLYLGPLWLPIFVFVWPTFLLVITLAHISAAGRPPVEQPKHQP
jgi:hypothetical protein